MRVEVEICECGIWGGLWCGVCVCVCVCMLSIPLTNSWETFFSCSYWM